MRSLIHIVLGKSLLRGHGNPPIRDNSSRNEQALIFTAFVAITLMKKPCYVSVEIYVLDAAESLLCW